MTASRCHPLLWRLASHPRASPDICEQVRVLICRTRLRHKPIVFRAGRLIELLAQRLEPTNQSDIRVNRVHDKHTSD